MLPILQCLRIAKCHHSRYPILDSLTATLDSAVRQSRSLAVPARYNDGGRACSGCRTEENLHLAYACRRGAAGEEVCLWDTKVVYAFCGDVGGAEEKFEGVGELRAYFIALRVVSDRLERVGGKVGTMLPGLMVSRAKITMTGLQPKVDRSWAVMPVHVWRA